MKANIYKICIIGDQMVGKTSLMQRFRFRNQTGFLPGNLEKPVNEFVTLFEKEGPNNGIPTMLHILEWTKEKKTEEFFKEASGVVLVFDLTQRETLYHIKDWVDLANQNIGKKVPMVLVGNKSDSSSSIEESKIKNIAKKFDTPFFAVSAKTGHQVEEMFRAISIKVVSQIEHQ
jgi:GTPase SAR1 family protein